MLSKSRWLVAFAVLSIFVGLAVLYFQREGATGHVVGGPMCGPICGPVGPHYWEQSCDGTVERTNIIDGYFDTCYGTPEGMCRVYSYGTTPEGYQDMNVSVLEDEMPCDELFPKPEAAG